VGIELWLFIASPSSKLLSYSHMNELKVQRFKVHSKNDWEPA